MKKALIIICVVLLVLGVVTFFAVDFAGDIAIKSIINSVDTNQLDSMLGKTETPVPTAPDSKSNAPQQTGGAKSTPKPAVPKTDKIEYSDKVQAISMITSKFSASEISYYQKKVDEGVTTELINEVKTKLKERCTPAELAQIKEWYEKYK